MIDERKGRLVAEQRGLIAVGTLNILDAADRRGLLDLEQAVLKLGQTSFHVAPELIAFLIEQARGRKRA